MALVPLNVSPALRPWRQAGVTHLLLDEAVRERLFAAPAPVESVPQRMPERQPSAVPGAYAQVPPARPVSSPQPQAVQQQTSPRPARPEMPPPRTESPAPNTSGTPNTPNTSGTPNIPHAESKPASSVLPPERWTAFWKDLLARTPSHPALVWTYPALSRDLGGAADAAHRDFLRHLLGDMGLPKGTHAFWPLNRYPYASGESEETVEATMFMSGVSALNPNTVILMSGVIPPELGVWSEKLAELRPLRPAIVQGRRFVVTQHVDVLIQNPQRYAQLITFLKGLLAGH